MRIQDYAASKRMIDLLNDKKFRRKNTEREAIGPWTWDRILLIKQLRAEFGLYLIDSKHLVYDVIEKVIADEELLGKIKKW
jgi:hypothetical protein